MEWLSSSLMFSGICFTIALWLLITSIKNARKSSSKLPPGPTGWPVIGNLLDMGAMPHHSLANLSQKYGPVMWLRLGANNAIVVSSAEAAKEMFKNHDHQLSGRTSSEAVKVHDFDKGMIVFQQSGPRWRMLRRIITAELTTKNRVNQTQDMRAKGVDTLIRLIRNEAQEKGSIQIRRFVASLGFNSIGNVSLSKENMVDPQSQQGDDYFGLICKFAEWVGKPNMADFFPLLRWLDPQGIKKNTKQIIAPALNYAADFVKERVLQRQQGKINSKKDLLDVMLDVGVAENDESAKMTEKDISITITELFLGATDTTSSSIEWAMLELLRKPDTMKKLKAELDEVVGPGNKVKEEDIEKLEYLQAVMKESMRLHPLAPFLGPRKALEDTVFMGYSIPKDTQVMVNVWAIGRDSECWEDPSSFKPERFLESGVDFKGQHFQFLPFGGGRRICPGLALGQRMLYLVLGSLIHTFDWSLENGISPQEIDMSEVFGMVVQKADPLMVVPTPRVAQENHGTVTDLM